MSNKSLKEEFVIVGPATSTAQFTVGTFFSCDSNLTVVYEVLHNNFLRNVVDLDTFIWDPHYSNHWVIVTRDKEYTSLSPIERKIRQMDERRKQLGYRW